MQEVEIGKPVFRAADFDRGKKLSFRSLTSLGALKQHSIPATCEGQLISVIEDPIAPTETSVMFKTY
jgi:hypothetical protein